MADGHAGAGRTVSNLAAGARDDQQRRGGVDGFEVRKARISHAAGQRLAGRGNRFEAGCRPRGTGCRRHRAIDEQTARVSLADYLAVMGESIANQVDLLVRLNASRTHELRVRQSTRLANHREDGVSVGHVR